MIGFLLMILLSGVLIILSIFAILLFRNVAIVLLVIVAPIAFACAILPNTKKLFDKWWGMFRGMLILYPTIAILFGGCKLGATIIGNANLAIGSTGQALAALGISVIPLIATPAIMKGALKSLDVLGGNIGSKFGDQAYKVSRGGVVGAGKAFGRTGLGQYAKATKASFIKHRDQQALKRGSKFATTGLTARTVGSLGKRIGGGVNKLTKGKTQGWGTSAAKSLGLAGAHGTLAGGAALAAIREDRDAQDEAQAWMDNSGLGNNEGELSYMATTGKMRDGSQLSEQQYRLVAGKHAANLENNVQRTQFLHQAGEIVKGNKANGWNTDRAIDDIADNVKKSGHYASGGDIATMKRYASGNEENNFDTQASFNKQATMSLSDAAAMNDKELEALNGATKSNKDGSLDQQLTAKKAAAQADGSYGRIISGTGVKGATHLNKLPDAEQATTVNVAPGLQQRNGGLITGPEATMNNEIHNNNTPPWERR